MSDLSALDRNFRVNTDFGYNNIEFYDVTKPPFSLHGLYEPFRRLPLEVSNSISPSLTALAEHMTGVRVRFRTNSTHLAIHADMPAWAAAPHMSPLGVAGFDIYMKQGDQMLFYNSFFPAGGPESGGLQGLFNIGEGEKELMLHFPIYAAVTNVFIGVSAGAEISPPSDYTIKKPVVFYGSSITHGGCASRPGTCYPCRISRMLNCDFLSLGFSGNAFGEEAIARYIADLEQSVFVCDYDHNSSGPEHLRETHRRMYEIIRAKQPDLPYIMVSKPDFCISGNEFRCEIAARPDMHNQEQRRQVIMETYCDAIKAGDRHVYFVDGAQMFGCNDHGDCTVDACHPTDLGFYFMANAIAPVIRQALVESHYTND